MAGYERLCTLVRGAGLRVAVRCTVVTLKTVRTLGRRYTVVRDIVQYINATHSPPGRASARMEIILIATRTRHRVTPPPGSSVQVPW
jgi:hypothetical protein